MIGNWALISGTLITNYQSPVTLSQSSVLKYNIFNLNGEIVQNNTIGQIAKGENEQLITLQSLPSGIYFLQLQTELSFKTVSFIVK